MQRYPAFFISTNDATIKFRRPCRVNLMVKRNIFKIELFAKIPVERISSINVQHDVADKQLSAGKAVAGAVIAGGVGAIVGGAMGGKKVTSVLTVNYANTNGEVCEVVLEAKLASQIKEKIEKYRDAHQPPTQPVAQQSTKPHNMTFKRGLIIYLTWPYQLLKKLTSR